MKSSRQPVAGPEPAPPVGNDWSVLSSLQERFSWQTRDPFTCESVWRSPNAEFRRFRQPSTGETLIVKAGTNWDTGHAQRVYDELLRVRSLLEPLGVRVPRPLGWSDSPAVVAMEDVAGEELIKRTIPQASYLAWPGGTDALLRMISLCGRAIARYQAAEPAPGRAEVLRSVHADVRRAALRGLVRPGLARAHAEGLQVARGYRFSANDFLSDGERLILVDPPHLVRYDLIQRDLSSFTFEVERSLRMPGLEQRNGEFNSAIRQAFLQGYEAELAAVSNWDWNPGPGRGEWILRLYELSRIGGMALNQAKARRAQAAFSGLSWALERRRTLLAGSRPKRFRRLAERFGRRS